MNVAVVGCGYVGLVSGVVCAKGYTAYRAKDPAATTSSGNRTPRGVSLDSIPIDAPAAHFPDARLRTAA